jgi:N-acetylglutamate synthase-like GNAT family acetyltransferase
MSIEIRQPDHISEWAAYYDLRWEILRKPWNQPRGSEQDEFEKEACHVMAIGEGKVLGVGRIHLPTHLKAQVRYMATAPEARGRGIGTSILQQLEKYAREVQAHTIVLNARAGVLGFYQKSGYEVVEKGEILFGSVEHWKMQKDL